MNEANPKAVVVYHDYYGCETGCCGHRIEMAGRHKFVFSHPYKEDFLEWAKQLVMEQFGEAHVADLDWENCLVIDD